MQNYLEMPISDFYDIENKYVYTKVKNMIAPIICYVERNLNEIYFKQTGTGVPFQNTFLYVSSKLNNEELDEFMALYNKIRCMNVHARTFYSKGMMKLKFDFTKLSDGYDFMDLDVPFTTQNNELTMYGVLAVLGLLLNPDQLKSLLNVVGFQEYFDIPREYKAFAKKAEIIEKYSRLNNIRDSAKDNEIVFCEEQFIVPIVAESFLILEEELLKTKSITTTRAYSAFSEVVSYMDVNDDIKRELINTRNMWAHGNCFYYTSESDNMMVDYIKVLEKLLHTAYHDFAFDALNKIKRVLLNLKYKRPAEMVMRLQQDRYDREALIDRLGKMERFTEKDKMIPLSIERMISSIHLKGVYFYYQNKEVKFDNYRFSSIEIINHISEKGENLVVDGYDIGKASFKEYRLPEYPPLTVLTASGVEGTEHFIVETAYVKQKSMLY